MPNSLRSESSLPSELPQLAHTGAGLLSFPRRRKEQRGRERDLSLVNMMLFPFLSPTQLTVVMLLHITTPFPAHEKHGLGSGCSCCCPVLLYLQDWVQHRRMGSHSNSNNPCSCLPQVVPATLSFGPCPLQWLALPRTSLIFSFFSDPNLSTPGVPDSVRRGNKNGWSQFQSCGVAQPGRDSDSSPIQQGANHTL